MFLLCTITKITWTVTYMDVLRRGLLVPIHPRSFPSDSDELVTRDDLLEECTRNNTMTYCNNDKIH
jgi:hypothetical protein